MLNREYAGSFEVLPGTRLGRFFVTPGAADCQRSGSHAGAQRAKRKLELGPLKRPRSEVCKTTPRKPRLLGLKMMPAPWKEWVAFDTCRFEERHRRATKWRVALSPLWALRSESHRVGIIESARFLAHSRDRAFVPSRDEKLGQFGSNTSLCDLRSMHSSLYRHSHHS